MLLAGSCLLAASGRTRKLQLAPFGVAGRDSVAVNLIAGAGLAMDKR
jgi:hypothetical protein